jgi:hypothetical protein
MKTKAQLNRLPLQVDPKRRISSPSFGGILHIRNAADVSGTFRRRKVRIPDLYMGQENIGTQIAFIVAGPER